MKAEGQGFDKLSPNGIGRSDALTVRAEPVEGPAVPAEPVEGSRSD
jgi:hypothetical protein